MTFNFIDVIFKLKQIYFQIPQILKQTFICVFVFGCQHQFLTYWQHRRLKIHHNKSFILENPSKSEVIGRCGGDEKTEWQRRTDKSRTLKNLKQMKSLIDKLLFYFYEQVSGAEVSDVCFRQFQTSINKSSALLCLNVFVTVYTIHYVGHTGIIQYVIVKDSVK